MTRRSRRRAVWTAAALCLLAGGLAGCDNTLDPYARESYFSIRGYLSLSDARQFIRVESLAEPVTADTTRTLDAEVVLENLTAGTREVLRDSVIVFDGVTVTHNFWTDTPVQGDATYRIHVTRSDGAVTRATTTTPTAAAPSVSPDSGGTCLNRYVVRFTGARRVLEADVGYRAGGQTHWIARRRDLQTLPSGDPGLAFVPESDLAPIVGVVDNVQTRPLEVRCSRLDEGVIQIRYVYVSDNWTTSVTPGVETYDPTRSQDIENGIGFFGAMREGLLTVPVSTALYADGL